MKYVKQRGDYVAVSGKIPSECLTFLRRSVPPLHRFYDESQRAWYVHTDYVVSLTQLSMHLGAAVDYAGLPARWVDLLDEQKHDWQTVAPKLPDPTPTKMSTTEALRVLHLKKSAPSFVVRAAYKAMSREHHPDVGGAEDTFKKVNLAYEILSNHEE